MREVRRSALVPYTPGQMYSLVNDVAGYPAFVPFCPATSVLEASATSLTASIEVERAGIRVSLTTRNTLVPGESIHMVLIDGPLKSFDGRWQFIAIHDAKGALKGCRVELGIDFEFRSAALGLVAGPVFESSWNALVDAFVRRAHEIYGG